MDYERKGPQSPRRQFTSSAEMGALILISEREPCRSLAECKASRRAYLHWREAVKHGSLNDTAVGMELFRGDGLSRGKSWR
jgi:hypothetical protein